MIFNRSSLYSSGPVPLRLSCGHSYTQELIQKNFLKRIDAMKTCCPTCLLSLNDADIQKYSQQITTIFKESTSNLERNITFLLSNDLNAFFEDYKKNENELKSLKKENLKLNKKLSDTEEKVQQLEQKYQTLSSALSDQAQQIKELKSPNNDINSELIQPFMSLFEVSDVQLHNDKGNDFKLRNPLQATDFKLATGIKVKQRKQTSAGSIVDYIDEILDINPAIFDLNIQFHIDASIKAGFLTSQINVLLSKCQNLLCLGLEFPDCCEMDSPSFESIFKNLEKFCPNLQELELLFANSNGIDNEAIASIGDYIETASLKKFSLEVEGFNFVTNKSIISLCESLSNAPNLNQLEIRFSNCKKVTGPAFSAIDEVENLINTS